MEWNCKVAPKLNHLTLGTVHLNSTLQEDRDEIGVCFAHTGAFAWLCAEGKEGSIAGSEADEA